MTSGLFDEPRPAPPTREDLERRLAEALKEYAAAGGAEARRLGLEIRDLRIRLGRMRTLPPVDPKVHDGRLAATGEAKEDERA